jgi:hypothetical protein
METKSEGKQVAWELLILGGVGMALLIVTPFALRTNYWYQLGQYHGARAWRLIEYDLLEQRLRETEAELAALRQAYTTLQAQIAERIADEPLKPSE